MSGLRNFFIHCDYAFERSVKGNNQVITSLCDHYSIATANYDFYQKHFCLTFLINLFTAVISKDNCKQNEKNKQFLLLFPTKLKILTITKTF